MYGVSVSEVRKYQDYRKWIQRKELGMKYPKINTNFIKDLYYVKKNVKPGCIVLMKDHRAFDGEYNNAKRAFEITKLFSSYVLCVNDIGLTECFDYADLTNAYEHGRLEFA